MGDKSVPYSLLKSVMVTCQGSDYRNISLAVNHVYPAGLSGAAAAKDAALNNVEKVGG